MDPPETTAKRPVRKGDMREGGRPKPTGGFASKTRARAVGWERRLGFIPTDDEAPGDKVIAEPMETAAGQTPRPSLWTSFGPPLDLDRYLRPMQLAASRG